MASKGKQLSELLDANGDVLQVNLDNVVVNATSVSDTDNTSTGQFTLPAGTTAQRPVTSYTGAQRYNTDLSVMEFYNGEEWLKISAQTPSVTSISGDINDAYESTLTLTGLNFLVTQGSVEFTPSGGSTTSVNVTPTSDTQLTVSVPAAIYGESAGTVVTIEYTNGDGVTSISGVTKTIIAAPAGGTITTDGGDRIHTFTTSGTFNPGTMISSVRYLIVAGGGGGGAIGGGGGAGGLLAGTSMSVSNTSYSVTVGAGANGGASSTAGGNGGNSIFNGLTAIGGGGGGSHAGGANSINGQNGGSGGGGPDNYSTFTYGSGTAGQGNRGGHGSTGHGTTDRRGGGGGGAGAAGSDSAPAHGGIGVQNDILGTNYYWAGGGGGSPYGNGSTGTSGGNGGLGGGGGASGGANGAGAAGTGGGSALNSGTNGQNGDNLMGGLGGQNTGGGGGGLSWAYNGTSERSGGDGIVVIRYTM